MIRLLTRKYCEECPVFEPRYTSALDRSLNKLVHTISCKNYSQCAAIEEMVRKEIKEEQENED